MAKEHGALRGNVVKLRNGLSEACCHHTPEPIPRMSIVELVLPRFCRWKRSQDQDSAAFVKDRLKAMLYVLIFRHAGQFSADANPSGTCAATLSGACEYPAANRNWHAKSRWASVRYALLGPTPVMASVMTPKERQHLRQNPLRAMSEAQTKQKSASCEAR